MSDYQIFDPVPYPWQAVRTFVVLIASASFGFWQGNFFAGLFMLCILSLLYDFLGRREGEE